ncbi:MAG: translocation/assembly module TamB domain-containing protein [Fibrobacterota bacterium]
MGTKTEIVRIWWMRFIRLFRWMFLAVFLLVLALQPMLNTPYVGRRLLRLVNARIPGRISLSNQKISFWRGRFSCTDFSLFDEAGNVVFSAEKILVEPRLFSLLRRDIRFERIELTAPNLSLIVDSSGTSNIQRSFGLDQNDEKASDRPLHFMLRDGVIRRGRVQYASPSHEGYIDSLSGSVYLNTRYNDLSCNLISGPAGYESSQRSVMIDSLRLEADVVEGDINSVAISMRAENTAFDLSGSLYNLFDAQTVQGSMTGSLETDSLFLAEVSGQKMPFATYAVQADFDGTVDNPQISLAAQVHGKKTGYIRLNAMLADKIVHLDSLTLSKGDNRYVSASGQLDLGKVLPKEYYRADASLKPAAARWDLSGVFRENLAHPLAEGLLLQDINSDFSLQGEGLVFPDLTAEAVFGGGFQLNSTRSTKYVNARGSARLEGTVLHVDTLSLNDGTARLEGAGHWQIERDSLSADILLADIDLQKFSRFAGGEHPLKGLVSGRIDLAGRSAVPDVRVSMTARGAGYGDFRADSIALRAHRRAGDGRLKAKLLLIDTLTELHANCTIPLFEGNTNILRNAPVISAALSGDIATAEISEGLLAGQIRMDGAYTGALPGGTGFLDIQTDSLKTPVLDLRSLSMPLRLESGRISIDQGRMLLDSSGAVLLSGTVDSLKYLDLVLKGDDIRLEKIPILAEKKLAGRTDIVIQADSSIQNPFISARIGLDSLVYDDIYFDDSLALAADFYGDTLNASLSGPFQAHGLYTRAGAFEIQAMADSFNLAPFFHRYYDASFGGAFTGSLHAVGKNNRLDSLLVMVDDLGIQARRDEADTVQSQVAAVGNDSLLYRDDSLFLNRFDVVFGAGNQHISLTGALAGSGDMSLSAEGKMPLSRVEYFTDALDSVSGSLSLGLDVSGHFSDPFLQGRITLDEGRAYVPRTNQRIHNLSWDISFGDNYLIKPYVEGNIDQGEILVTGQATYDKYSLSGGSVTLRGEELPLRFPGSAEFVLDGGLKAAFGGERIGVSGYVDILEGYYYRDVDFLPGASSGGAGRQTAAVDLSDKERGIADLDITVHPRENIYVDNNLAFLEIKPDISITGTDHAVSAEGRAEVVSGEISYYNRNFTVTRGEIVFLNPRRLEVEVDITATARVRGYRITLTLTGNPEGRLDFSLLGESPDGRQIDDADIVSLLVTGYTRSELQSDDVGVREALVRQVQDLVNNMDRQYSGIDSVSFDFNSERGGTAISLSEELTRRLATAVELDVSEGESYTRATVILRLLENLSLKSFTDTEGHSGGEIEFELKGR